jgi:hypothetical protein
MQPLGSSGKTTVLDDRQKITQITQVHIINNRYELNKNYIF